MDFFDFLFGKRYEKKEATQTPSKANEDKPQSAQPFSMDSVEQYVKESVENLSTHTGLSTKVLEAEAIYLAAYLYMKGSYQIDFELDYLSTGILDKIPSKNYNVADKVFTYMVKYGGGHYGIEERDYGINGYKMNIQMCPDYGNYVKNYFIKAHKIGSGRDFNHFSSPRNCLWRNGEKVIDSPTQRDIYYKFDRNLFEFMIPPYNPLVTGQVVKRDESTLRCESNDGRRSFVFHFHGALRAENLNYIEMFRNDKGDMVTYHKE